MLVLMLEILFGGIKKRMKSQRASNTGVRRSLRGICLGVCLCVMKGVYHTTYTHIYDLFMHMMSLITSFIFDEH